MVTLRLRDSRIAPRLAADMPLPNEETTPPVTKIYLVMKDIFKIIADGLIFYFKAQGQTINTFNLFSKLRMIEIFSTHHPFLHQTKGEAF